MDLIVIQRDVVFEDRVPAKQQEKRNPAVDVERCGAYTCNVSGCGAAGGGEGQGKCNTGECTPLYNHAINR